jgi:hypothetical protein
LTRLIGIRLRRPATERRSAFLIPPTVLAIQLLGSLVGRVAIVTLISGAYFAIIVLS